MVGWRPEDYPLGVRSHPQKREYRSALRGSSIPFHSLLKIELWDPTYLIGTVYSSPLNRLHCSHFRKKAFCVVNPCTCCSLAPRELSLCTWWVINWIVEACYMSSAERGVCSALFKGTWLIKKEVLSLYDFVCLNLEIGKENFLLNWIFGLIFYLTPEGLFQGNYGWYWIVRICVWVCVCYILSIRNSFPREGNGANSDGRKETLSRLTGAR